MPSKKPAQDLGDGLAMKLHRYALALILATALMGCGGSDSPTTTDDTGPTSTVEFINDGVTLSQLTTTGLGVATFFGETTDDGTDIDVRLDSMSVDGPDVGRIDVAFDDQHNPEALTGFTPLPTVTTTGSRRSSSRANRASTRAAASA